MDKFKRKYYTYNFFTNFALERGILLTFFVTVCNFNLVEVGLLQSFYSLAIACAEIPAGIIGDKVGRKNSLIIGNGLKLIGIACFLLPSNFYLFSALMILQGVGMAFVSGSDQALLFDNLKARKEEEQFINISSIASSVIFLSAFIATICGGWLQSVSWHVVFIVTSLAIICSIYFIATINDQEGAVIDRKKVSVRTMMQEVFSKDFSGVRCLIIGTALFEASYMCFFMLSQNFFLKFEISVFFISVIYALSRLLSMCIYYILPKLRERISDRKLLMVSFAFVPINLLMNMMNDMFTYLTMFFLISFVAHIAPSIYWGKFNTMIHSAHRATLLSISSLLGSLMLSLLYFLAGNILESADTSLYFICLAFVALSGGLFILFISSKDEVDIL